MSHEIRLLILSDGKPGHVTGSMGVLKSLEKLVPVKQTTLQIHLRLKFMRHPLRALLNHPNWIGRIPKNLHYNLMRFFYKVDDPQHLKRPDSFNWMVSTGGDTSFLSAWLAKRYDVKNIYCSSLRGLNPSLFTLLISIRKSKKLPNEIKMEIPPVPIDRENIAEQGRVFRTEQHLEETVLWAVLIGGNGSGYHYDAKAMSMMTNGLLSLAEQHGAKLLITTSRRTGLRIEETLKPLFKNHFSTAYTCLYNHHPEKVVAKFLGAADVVFCTADSGSMITESMAAGKPVYVLVPEKVKPQPFYRTFLQQHIDSRHIKQISFCALDTLDVNQDATTYFNLLEKDPIAELASKINKWIKI